jgi:energy-converting hydrogenase Eha subunit E
MVHRSLFVDVRTAGLFLVMMASEGSFAILLPAHAHSLLGLLLMRALALWHDCRPVKITLIAIYIVLYNSTCHVKESY